MSMTLSIELQYNNQRLKSVSKKVDAILMQLDTTLSSVGEEYWCYSEKFFDVKKQFLHRSSNCLMYYPTCSLAFAP